MGLTNFRFLIVGHGAEQDWLRERLPRAEFSGVLKGEALAEAYAKHGPVRLSLAHRHLRQRGSGGPGQRRSGHRHSRRRPANHCPRWRDRADCPDAEFAAAIAGILADPERHARMRQAARAYALTASWDAVFEGVYAGYETMLRPP
jgi:phosphatidylinositol alpha 1,6-mannosyltransferase